MQTREKEIRKITIIGAVANILLTVFKIIAGILGRSAAMIADGIHSLSDLLSDIIVLVFTHISSKGRDRDHSFGHGKFETLATLIVSVILIVVGARLMADGIQKIPPNGRHGRLGNSLPRLGDTALLVSRGGAVCAVGK